MWAMMQAERLRACDGRHQDEARLAALREPEGGNHLRIRATLTTPRPRGGSAKGRSATPR